jgi:diguanylate cyclase
MDVPCRYGGEEFAVILPSTNINDARCAAERFRNAVESSVTKFDGKQLAVTASIGVAQVHDNDNPIALIRRADDAMYKSKEAGRNCGHWHDGSRCLPVTEDALPPSANSAETDDGKTAADHLMNGSDFTEILQRRVVESQRFGLPLSILYLNVDDYRTIEQDYGKSIAKLALDSVATFFHSALREMDLLARINDGEFVAMLPGSTEAEAHQIAKRMQVAMSNCLIPIRDQQTRLTCSHGVAQLKPNETAPLLVARAKGSIVPKAVAV